MPGSVVDCGTIAVERDEVLAFGRRFDPQPSTPTRTRRRAVLGGVIARRLGALMMRLFVQRYISSVAIASRRGLVGSPVRPGDVLHVVIAVEEARRSRSKPDRGVVVSQVTVRNQHGEGMTSG